MLWLSSMSPRKSDFEIEFWAIFCSILFATAAGDVSGPQLIWPGERRASLY